MTESPTESPAADSSVPLKILVVEDNAVNQKIATWRLEKLGHEVTVVENGTDALLAVERMEYDLILMDVQMPDLDGCEVTRRIRKLEAEKGKRRAYIVAMTALVLKSDVDDCLKVGMDDFMSKPLRPDRLQAAIEQARGQAGRSGSLEPSGGSPGTAYSLRAFIERLDEEDRNDVLDAARIFQKSLPADREEFRKAVVSGDLDEIRFQVHTLTGVSGVFEIPSLLSIGEAIEQAAIGGNEAEMKKQCQNFDQALGHLIKEINTVLGG